MSYSIVIATNRPNSRSGTIGEIYHEKFVSKGIDVKVLNFIDLPRDFVFSNMFGEKHEDFSSIQQLVFDTEKFLFVIPEYNGGFPGILKAFIDACKFPTSFSGKKCCLVGVSDGQFGNIRGLEHFTGIANYIKMDVLHMKMYFPNIEKLLNDQNELADPAMIRRIERQIDAFIAM